MSLLLPDYPDPQGAPGTTIPQAYAWIEHLQLGFSDGSGRIVLWIHRSPEAAGTWVDPEQPNTPPADQVEFRPGDGVIPTLPDLLADPEFKAAFDVIRDQLYGFIKANKFPEAIDAPVSTYTRRIEATLLATGLTAGSALGYRVEGVGGVPLRARTTTGVTEDGTSACYYADVANWDTEWVGTIVWDAGAGTLAREAFQASAGAAGPGGTSVTLSAGTAGSGGTVDAFPAPLSGSTLDSTAGAYDGMKLLFQSGTLAGTARRIDSYEVSGGTATFDFAGDPFAEAPSLGDTFVIG